MDEYRRAAIEEGDIEPYEHLPANTLARYQLQHSTIIPALAAIVTIIITCAIAISHLHSW